MFKIGMYVVCFRVVGIWVTFPGMLRKLSLGAYPMHDVFKEVSAVHLKNKTKKPPKFQKWAQF